MILLIVHVAFSLLSVVLCLLGFSRNTTLKMLSSKLFFPSVIVIVLSGAGLIIEGAGVVRACISGAITLVSMGLIVYVQKKGIIKDWEI